MDDIKALKGRVVGRVQGVFFRVSAHEQARRLGISGWVKNTDEGAVELLVAGPASALEAMREWLHRGPPQARVDRVELEDCEVPGLNGFEIR